MQSTESLAGLAARALAEGRVQDARALAQQVAAAGPLNPVALRVAGRIAHDSGDYGRAVQFYRLAGRLAPGHAATAAALAVAYGGIGAYEPAAECLRPVAEEPGASVEVLYRYAGALFALGRRAEADAVVERVRATTPVSARDRYLRGLLDLWVGDWRAGWRGVEARWEADMYGRPWLRAPWSGGEQFAAWDGRALPDRTLWVHPEGGVGDTLFFARFIARAAGRVGRVVVTSVRTLDPLLLSVPGVAEVRRYDDPRAADCVHAGVMSLPHLTGAGGPSAADVPYVRAPLGGPAAADAAGGGLRVGLVWGGNPLMAQDHDRSVPDAGVLLPMLGVPGVAWTSLQVGHRAAWADGLPIASRPVLGTFADTAAAMARLDLVVTVCTGAANLAGALGVPFWVMPSSLPEYRWTRGGARSPWYPSGVVFRRRHTADWPGVVGRIAAALAAHVARGTTPATDDGAVAYADLGPGAGAG